MNRSKMAQFVRGVKMNVSKHGPEILMGLGIAGMITTVVLAVKETPKALDLIAEAEDKKGEQLKKTEVVKATWKCYIPAAVTGATSIACLVGASTKHAKRNAALATAYKLSETALSEYREKVVETIGEEKEKVVREKVSEEKLKQNPIEKNEIIFTDNGDTQFYEPLSGRYFKSDIEHVNKIVNRLNKSMLHDMFGYITLNEFYEELGLDMVELGEDLGWNLDKGLIDIEFTSKIASNGKPCIVLDYINAPHYNYDK